MFTNKVVLLTGASSRIGADTAIKLAELNAQLVLTGRNKNNIAIVGKRCEEHSPTKLIPLCITADITKEAEVEYLMKKVIDRFKRLDVLVNNADIFDIGTIKETSLEQFDSVFNTNLRGPYYLTMLATPHLIKSKGNIVNVSSVAGMSSFSGILAYCMSKSALDKFTRCVSLELAIQGVRVNSVNPGVLEAGFHLRTGISEAEFEQYMERYKETHAVGRIGTTQEVAQTIIFLASDDASNITGRYHYSCRLRSQCHVPTLNNDIPRSLREINKIVALKVF